MEDKRKTYRYLHIHTQKQIFDFSEKTPSSIAEIANDAMEESCYRKSFCIKWDFKPPPTFSPLENFNSEIFCCTQAYSTWWIRILGTLWNASFTRLHLVLIVAHSLIFFGIVQTLPGTASLVVAVIGVATFLVGSFVVDFILAFVVTGRWVTPQLTLLLLLCTLWLVACHACRRKGKFVGKQWWSYIRSTFTSQLTRYISCAHSAHLYENALSRIGS